MGTRIKDRVKAALKARGGTLSLLNVFKEFDTDKTGQLSWDEFCGAFRSCGLAAAPQEIRGIHHSRFVFTVYRHGHPFKSLITFNSTILGM